MSSLIFILIRRKEMTTIKINVTNKTAICQKRYLISANSNYQIKFTFDDEWSLSDAKTARIVFDAEYYDILFTGDTVMLPKIPACKTLAVGVFTDQLATNLAELGCIISAADFDGTAVTEFTESQYDQIVGLLNELDLRQIQSIARGKDTLIVGYNNMTFDVLPLYDGVGIETAGLNENGELLLTLTNSTTINCGSALGPKGDKGDKGDTGDPFTYSDFTDEQLAGLKGPKGDKGDKGDSFTYSDFTDEQLEALQGPKGDKGEKGDKGDKGDIGETPVLSIGTVTTVDPTEQADISLSGSAENPILNLRIPKGEKGEGAEEIAQGIENFSKDMAGLDTKVSALSHQMAYAVRGYRDMSEYITNEALDANMDNLVLSEAAVIPEKMYIKYAGTKVLNIGSGFDGRTQVREVAFARDISFRQGLPSFANCTSLEKITFPEGVTALGSFAYTALKSIDCGSATKISSFNYCRQLEQISFPNVTSGGGFQYCEKLEQVNFPKLENVGTQCFWYSGLKKADFGSLSSIGNLAFWATPLETLIIRRETLCTLTGTRALGNTPISSGSGYVYVPSALVNTYKAATNWTAYSAQIRAIEDYPEITGGTV